MFVTIVDLRRRCCSSPSSPTTTSGARRYDGPEVYALYLVAATGGIVMGVGQRPDRAVRRAGDAVAGVLRPRRQLPPQGRQRRERHQVLRPRRLLVGVPALRHRPRLRRHRLDEHLRRSSPRCQGTRAARAQRRPRPGRRRPAARRARLQGRRRAVPRLDARRVPGRADAGHRRSWRRSARSPRSPRCCGCSSSALPFYRDDWRPVVWVLAVLSLVVGSFLAVVQTDVKRMLAYSSINHAGFMLVGVEAAGPPRRRGRQPASACRACSSTCSPTP